MVCIVKRIKPRKVTLDVWSAQRFKMRVGNRFKLFNRLDECRTLAGKRGITVVSK